MTVGDNKQTREALQKKLEEYLQEYSYNDWVPIKEDLWETCVKWIREKCSVVFPSELRFPKEVRIEARSWKERRPLVWAGKPPDYLYLIYRGNAFIAYSPSHLDDEALTKGDLDPLRVVGILCPGDVFGETEILYTFNQYPTNVITGLPYTLFSKGYHYVTVFRISKQDIVQFFSPDAKFQECCGRHLFVKTLVSDYFAYSSGKGKVFAYFYLAAQGLIPLSLPFEYKDGGVELPDYNDLSRMADIGYQLRPGREIKWFITTVGDIRAMTGVDNDTVKGFIYGDTQDKWPFKAAVKAGKVREKLLDVKEVNETHFEEMIRKINKKEASEPSYKERLYYYLLDHSLPKKIRCSIEEGGKLGELQEKIFERQKRPRKKRIEDPLSKLVKG